MSAGHFVIAVTDAEQPFHCRFVGANGEPVMSQENIADERDAERVVLLLAETFGWPEPQLERSIAFDDEATVASQGVLTRARVIYRDERVGSEPCS